ncbi:MAG: phosphate ABC transporter permease subunit PstC [Planctomycetota bacterium]
MPDAGATDPSLSCAALLDRAPQRGAVIMRLRDSTLTGLLFASGLFTIGITIAIVGVLAYETLHFFGVVGHRLDEPATFVEFITGLEWTPLLGAQQVFGVWPLLTGTMMVALIAAMVALPIGLIVAVFLSEYAHPKVRAALKPILELLAGIPTVVYGFFALTVITPALQWISKAVQVPFTQTPFEQIEPAFGYFNSTSAGIAVGIMCLPMVSSLSEDALRAVPRSLRDGAFAMGGTRFDVSVRVVVPAALSGIIASFLLAIARAVGETMIVALAAGGLAQMAFGPTDAGEWVFRPHEGSQTMTAYMVQIFLGDAEFGSVEYYSSYAIGFTLFLMTLVLTLVGNWVLKRYREAYE